MAGIFAMEKRLAEVLVDLSTRIDSNPDRSKRGGVLTLVPNEFAIVITMNIGTVGDPAELATYFAFSREKAFRTYADFLRDPFHTVSSWQTRQEDINRYGGAVLFRRGRISSPVDIISFSGLNEHVDEAISLIIGKEMRLASEDHIGRVIDISKNLVYRELYEAYVSKHRG